MNFKRAAATAGAFLTVTVLAACTVDGTAIRGPIDLDTGRFSTELNAPAGSADTENQVSLLKAIRLGEQIVFRDEVDPALTTFGMPTYPLSTSDGLRGVFSDAKDLPTTSKLLYGFSTAGSADTDQPDSKGYNHGVFVYPDAATANAAVSELSGLLRKPKIGTPAKNTTVAGMPAETVALRQMTAGNKTTATLTLTPVGSTVIYTWADAPNAEWTRTAVRVSYEKQKALLAAMPPISDDKQIDPHGLLRAVIPASSDSAVRISGQVVGPRTISQFSGNSAKAYATFQKAGVTEVAVGGALLFATGSDKQAADLAADIAEASDDSTARKAPSPRDLSTAKCITSKSGGGSATCVIAIGKYVVQVTGDKLLEVQQKTAAEYVLVKKL
ncbi:DUF7373 family lipoprotein [Gordonia sp. (in: high G+C Gram-positive bacteria)]|uniref:DUF7373 family lipoprotein n=1 Tax=Gordonia sp. (in: high G+C Gram-positive bacteria) TaxID=84139 RepID=UPI003C725133